MYLTFRHTWYENINKWIYICIFGLCGFLVVRCIGLNIVCDIHFCMCSFTFNGDCVVACGHQSSHWQAIDMKVGSTSGEHEWNFTWRCPPICIALLSLLLDAVALVIHVFSQVLSWLRSRLMPGLWVVAVVVDASVTVLLVRLVESSLKLYERIKQLHHMGCSILSLSAISINRCTASNSHK